jgi:Tfp pilus assembly protein PilV
MKYQQGSTMLEGLISILIFSFGMLGTVAFQANMINQSMQTQYRLTASMAMSSLIGAAEADPAKYTCYTYPTPTTPADGSGCNTQAVYVKAWAAEVATNKGFVAPSVALDATQNLVVTLSWSLPHEKDTGTTPKHNLTATAHPVVVGGTSS